MADLSLSLALPVVAGGLAYANARYSIGSDFGLIRRILTAKIKAGRRVKANRINIFYTLEEKAFAASTANNAFFAMAPTVPAGIEPAELAKLHTTEYTYSEAYSIILKYAAWLRRDYGISNGDIVALDVPNKAEFMFLWFACWSLGAVPAFINTSVRGKALLHCVQTSTAKLLIVDSSLNDVLTDDVLAGLQEGKHAVQSITLDQTVLAHIDRLEGLRVDDAERGCGPSDAGMLIFTSGTTGLPKAAVIPWLKMLSSGDAVASLMRLTPKDRYLTPLPLYHVSGAMLGVIVALTAGATIIIAPKFSPRTYFQTAALCDATCIQYIGEMCRYLVSTPPSPSDTNHKIRFAFGNGLRPDVWQEFKDRFALDEIIEFYGATESPASTFMRNRNSFGRGAVGRAGRLLKIIASTTIILRYDHDTGEPYRDPKTGLCVECDTNEAGEMVTGLDPKDIKDKYTGYWGNEKASSSKLLRDVMKKGDVYFRTGDLMRQDKEDRVFFVDRVGDTFRWKGENVATNEVEAVVASHPAIEEANAYGVQLPNHDGRAGCAAITLTTSDTASDDVLRSLAEKVKKELPKFAHPLFLRVVTSMEMTGTSKYTKHGLRTEGVDPEKTGKDRVFWLHPQKGTYVEFGRDDWKGLVGGQTKL